MLINGTCGGHVTSVLTLDECSNHGGVFNRSMKFYVFELVWIVIRSIDCPGPSYETKSPCPSPTSAHLGPWHILRPTHGLIVLDS